MQPRLLQNAPLSIAPCIHHVIGSLRIDWTDL